MSVAEPTAPGAMAETTAPAPAPRPKRRPLLKRAMHAVRRAHLYFGLFLLPWAVLYGITGFLFNHPTAFSDAPTTSFGTGELAGTPMESVPAPAEVATQVVAGLNARAKDGKTYTLVEPEKARWANTFASATVKTGDREVSVLFDLKNSGGTVRSSPLPPPAKVEEPAPFAVGNSKGGGEKGGKGGKGGGRGEKGGGKGEARGEAVAPDAIKLDPPLTDRVKAAVPVVLERTGFPSDGPVEARVPDLIFQISDGAKTWRATYSSAPGSVGGTPLDDAPPPGELSTRRFLTRMHLSHGYPGDANARWFWALIVDAMAFVMVFWGVSGVFMWWQLRATRKLGFLILVLSIVAATALGLGMHDTLAPK